MPMLYDFDLPAIFVLVLSLVMIGGCASSRILQTSSGLSLPIIHEGAGPTVSPEWRSKPTGPELSWENPHFLTHAGPDSLFSSARAAAWSFAV